MEYVQTHSTRKKVYLLTGVLFIVIGGLLTPVMLYGVIAEKATGVIVPAVICVLLLVAGIVLIYRFFVPRIGKGIVTEHSIRCELNGSVKHELLKEDIDHISVPETTRYSIKVIMKEGKGFHKTINCFYFQDLEDFYTQLLALGYKATQRL